MRPAILLKFTDITLFLKSQFAFWIFEWVYCMVLYYILIVGYIYSQLCSICNECRWYLACNMHIATWHRKGIMHFIQITFPSVKILIVMQFAFIMQINSSVLQECCWQIMSFLSLWSCNNVCFSVRLCMYRQTKQNLQFPPQSYYDP